MLIRRLWRATRKTSLRTRLCEHVANIGKNLSEYAMGFVKACILMINGRR